MSKLELRQVHKRFGGVVALHDLTLSIESGQFVSLLGPSGCGKTTALRIVAGFEQADAGSVVIDGQDVSRVPANKRDMGMVFQAYSLFPNMTARQNVEFGMRIRGKSRKERAARAEHLLSLVGLSQAMDRYAHQLSGGQQQRVALARALAIEPHVLLLDEPLSALDAKVRVQLREEIRRIQLDLGITALYVTHDQEEALSVSDLVVVLSQGRIEQVGTPAEIYESPSTVFVAEFIGTMNRIRATVESRESVESGGIVLRTTAASDHPAGSEVLLLLRPESISLNREGTGASRGLAGTIAGHTFLGSLTRLQIETRVGSMVVDVGTAEALKLPIGQPVDLDWEPSSAQLLPLYAQNGGARLPSPVG
jgi:putative spermidine/putrescine transport system ATP-binding protein